MDLDGFGRIWSDLAGFGRIWSDLAGFGWIRSDSVRSDSVGVAPGRRLNFVRFETIYTPLFQYAYGRCQHVNVVLSIKGTTTQFGMCLYNNLLQHTSALHHSTKLYDSGTLSTLSP